MLWVWIAGGPLVLLAILLMGAYLEDHLVQPDLRATTIKRLMNSTTTDELVIKTAELLAVVAPPRRPAS